MPYGTVNADVIQTSTSGGILGAGNASIMKNRIINGAMVIDQRNGGASVTVTTANPTFTLDRYAAYAAVTSKYTVQQNAGSVTPPVGFSNYLGCTSSAATTVGSTDYYYLSQKIEGFNTADLNWGTANAKTVTLSFWVYSSLTGTFGGGIRNSAVNYCYPYSYTISSANTWTQVSVTITGPTSGTWIGATNEIGVDVCFSLGMGSTYSGTAGAWASGNYASATGATSVVGTNGATFYITGVQLEVGSSATGFEYVNYQTSLANCQRYFTMSFPQGTAPAQNAGTTGAITGEGQAASAPAYAYAPFKVSMRASPTVTTYNPSAANENWRNTSGGSDINVVVSNTGDSGTFIGSNTQVLLQYNICAIHYTASAEL
jgi:hypothetical protein